MPQANDATIVRVYTREYNGTIEDLTPSVSTGGHQFEVVVEAEAGKVRAGNSSRYTITLTAFDITAGNSAANISAAFNPATPTAPLKQTFETTKSDLPPAGGLSAGVTDNVTAWPAYEQKFIITLTANEAANAVGHIFRYTATLQAGGSDPIISITQSELFVLI